MIPKHYAGPLLGKASLFAVCMVSYHSNKQVKEHDTGNH